MLYKILYKELFVLANTKTRSAVTVLCDGIVTHNTRFARTICFRCIQRSIKVLLNIIRYIFFEFCDFLVNCDIYLYQSKNNLGLAKAIMA